MGVPEALSRLASNAAASTSQTGERNFQPGLVRLMHTVKCSISATHRLYRCDVDREPLPPAASCNAGNCWQHAGSLRAASRPRAQTPSCLHLECGWTVPSRRVRQVGPPLSQRCRHGDAIISLLSLPSPTQLGPIASSLPCCRFSGTAGWTSERAAHYSKSTTRCAHACR